MKLSGNFNEKYCSSSNNLIVVKVGIVYMNYIVGRILPFKGADTQTEMYMYHTTEDNS